MIQLKVNGEPLDLYPDTAIRMTINSGLFDNEVLEGSGSFPFDIPITPNNNRILGFPLLIENETPLGRKIDNVALHYDHVLIYQGYLRITSVKSAIRADFNIGLSKLADAMQNKTMQDFADETINLPTKSVRSVVVKCTRQYFHETFTGTAPFEIRVQINSTWYTADYSHQGLINLAGLINDSAFDVLAKNANTNFDANYFYYNQKKNIEFESLKCDLVIEDYDGTYTFDTELRNKSDSSTIPGLLYTYSFTVPDVDGYASNSYTNKVRFPMHNCPDFYEKNTAFCGILNDRGPYDIFVKDVVNAAQVITENNKDVEKWGNTLVPFVYHRYFVEIFADLLNINISGDPITDGIIANSHITGLKSLDNWEDIDIYAYGGAAQGWDVKINSHIKTFDLSDYLPNISIAKWLKSFRNMFGLHLFYDDKFETLYLNFLQEIIANTSYDEWSAKATADFTIEPNDYEGLYFPQNTNAIDDYLVDEAKTRIYNEAKIMPQPHTGIKGESPVLGSVSTESIFFATQASTSIPATTDEYLRWYVDASNGLAPEYWDKVIDFLKKTRLMKMRMNLSMADLLSLTEIGADGLPNIARKKRIRENNYLINSVDVQLTMNRIELADVEFYLSE